MQKLYVKVIENGVEVMKTISVLRAWSNEHTTIYLHANGVYGYRDGAPIREVDELKVMGESSDHFRFAKAWWMRTGKKQSRAHYEALAKAAAERAGHFQEGMPEVDSDLDMVMYFLRDLKKGPKSAVTGPVPWMECGFAARPDWWGQAVEVTFGDVCYQIATPEAESGETGETGEAGEAGENTGPATGSSPDDQELEFR